MHESFDREEAATPGSERSFGIVIGAVFGFLSFANWWHGGATWPWMTGIGALLFIAAFVYPAALKPFNWLWFKFGILLHNVVNPIIMGLLFYLAVLPTGLVMRALGKDMLRLKRAPESSSYWISRQPPGPAHETMKDQF